MKKEEILAKSRISGPDERVQSIWLTSFGFGNIMTMVLCFIFVCINGIRGHGYMEFMTIAFGSQSATNFYKYKELKDKKDLLISVFGVLLSIAFFILFIVRE